MPEPQHKLVKVKDLGVVAFPSTLPDEKIVAAIREFKQGLGVRDQGLGIRDKAPASYRAQTHSISPHFTAKTTEESEHARLTHNLPKATPQWDTLRRAVYKATEPVPENPNTTPTADTWSANRDAAWNAAMNAANVGGNILKRAGRLIFGVVDLAPQVMGIVKNLYSPDEKISQQAETDLLNLHPGAQVADRLKEAIHDWRRSKSLAAENAVGDLLGFYLLGKVGGKATSAERARLQQMGVVLPPETTPEPLGLPAPEPPTIEGTLTKPAPLPAPAGLRLAEVTANLQRTPVNLAELRKEAAARRPQAAPAEMPAAAAEPALKPEVMPTPKVEPVSAAEPTTLPAPTATGIAVPAAPELKTYAQEVVSSSPVQSVTLIGSTAAKGAGHDIDMLYDFGNVDLEKYRQHPDETQEELIEHLVETTGIDSEAYDSFYKVNGRHYHLSSGAGRAIVENTDYAKEQQGKPTIKLASKGVNPVDASMSLEYMAAEPVTMRLEYKGAGGAQPFYLKSEKILAEKMKGPMPGEDLVGMLENNGVKAEELKWTGLDELRGKEKVTPEEVRQHLAANNLQIEEVMKGEVPLPKLEIKPSVEEPGGWDVVSPNGQVRFTGTHIGEARQYIHEEEQMWSGAPLEGGPAKYGTWVMPGAEPSTYREMLLRLPAKERPPIQDLRLEQFTNENGGQDFHTWVNGSPWIDVGGFRGKFDAEKRVKKLWNEPGFGEDKFRSNHWGEPNVIGHVRFNDRTGLNGERLLHLEELQSDWHQKGRAQGYAKNLTQEDAVRLGYSVYRAKSNLGTDAYFVDGPDLPRGVIPSAGANTEAQAWAGLLPRLQKTENIVPDAPFKKTWPELLLKRMVRYAAENGYDGVSWTPGEEQAGRYDLSKQIDRVAYKPKDSGHTALWITDKKGGVLQDTIGEHIPGSTFDNVEKALVVPNSALPDLIGKELTEKIAKGEGAPAYGGSKIFEGVDLKVGGEGMKGFYDKIVPEAANKIGKQFGAKVGETEIQGTGIREQGSEKLAVPYLPITAEMRAGVMAEPFSLFKLEYKLPAAEPAEISEAWDELDKARDALNEMPPPGMGGGVGDSAWRSLSEPGAKLRWKAQHQAWLEQAQPLLDRYRAADQRLEYLDNKDLGQVRSLPGGEKILYLNRNGLQALAAGFEDTISPEYTLVGASLKAQQINTITENLRSNSNPFHKEIADLLAAAQDAQGNATVAAIPEKGQSLHEALYTLREELNHSWQKAFADAAGKHLSEGRFTELNAAIPQAMQDYLRQHGYSQDIGAEWSNRHRVLEVSAKLLSEAPETFGLSEDEAAAYLFEYFDAVEKQHGAKALNELKHITRLARQIKEDYSHAREGAHGESGAEGGGGVPGLQGEGPAGDQGASAPAEPGAPRGEAEPAGKGAGGAEPAASRENLNATLNQKKLKHRQAGEAAIAAVRPAKSSQIQSLRELRAEAEKHKPSPVSVRDPNGDVHTFPNEELAAKFRRAAGIGQDTMKQLANLGKEIDQASKEYNVAAIQLAKYPEDGSMDDTPEYKRDFEAAEKTEAKLEELTSQYAGKKAELAAGEGKAGKKKLAYLTPAEDARWDSLFAEYAQGGMTDEVIGHRVWEDLQEEFPRLREYEGAHAEVIPGGKVM